MGHLGGFMLLKIIGVFFEVLISIISGAFLIQLSVKVINHFIIMNLKINIPTKLTDLCRGNCAT